MDISVLPLLAKYRLGIRPKFQAVNPMPGEWASPYSGQGFELRSLREYQPGDDVRRIRPAESLRARRKIVADRIELRDITIVVVLDCSPSMRIRKKAEAQKHAAALLLFSAWKSESTFSLAFGNSRFMRPRTGEKHFNQAYRMLCEHTDTENDRQNAFDIASFCKEARKTISPQSIVFLLSDFLGPASLASTSLTSLRALARCYDMIAVCLQDELEYSFPVLSHHISSVFEDSETTQQGEVGLSQNNQALVRQLHEKRFGALREQARNAGIDWVHIPTSSIPEMYRLFTQCFSRRKKR